jgi:hypothetical protein
VSDVRPFAHVVAVPQPPGTWSRRPGGVVVFCCPLCSTGFQLEQTVLVDGTLGQVVTCPASSCDFRELVRLQGWEP